MKTVTSILLEDLKNLVEVNHFFLASTSIDAVKPSKKSSSFHELALISLFC